MSPPLPFDEKNPGHFDPTNFSPSKSLGQHFLKDPRIARFQIEALDLSTNEEVIEIGGGFGILTEILAEKAQRVWVYEKDPVLAEYLRNKFANVNHVSIIEEDALKAEFPKSAKAFASNIPYSISTPLTFKVAKAKFEKGVMLVQHEFAQKLSALPGSKLYRASSIAFQTIYAPKILRKVPRSYFSPPPKVESAILYFTKKQDSPIIALNSKEIDRYFVFLKRILTARNRVVKSALKPIVRSGSKKEFLAVVLEPTFSRRVRDLSIHEFYDLYSKMSDLLSF